MIHNLKLELGIRLSNSNTYVEENWEDSWKKWEVSNWLSYMLELVENTNSPKEVEEIYDIIKRDDEYNLLQHF